MPIQPSKEKLALALIISLAIAVFVALSLTEAIPQSMKYHSFSDAKMVFCVPNTLNVISNIPFLFVGIAGLVLLSKRSPVALSIVESNRAAYQLFFVGVSLVALGSGYYHLWPTNETLIWDRAPITVAFMALYSVVITEFYSEKLGRRCLIPLVCLGLASVGYWAYTESIGQGDLRYYAVVQFFPLVTIPIMLLLFQSRFSRVSGYWVLFGAYLLAKIFETYDDSIHGALGFLSGHTLKHLVSALGLAYLLSAFKKRRVLG